MTSPPREPSPRGRLLDRPVLRLVPRQRRPPGRLLSARVGLPPEAASAAAARAVVAAVLPVWGHAGRVDDAVLVVSELVANAMVHAPQSAVIDVEVSADQASVRIAVADGSSRPPVPGGGQGRGLRVVTALVARWGHEPVPGGKRVWAELR